MTGLKSFAQSEGKILQFLGSSLRYQNGHLWQLQYALANVRIPSDDRAAHGNGVTPVGNIPRTNSLSIVR